MAAAGHGGGSTGTARAQPGHSTAAMPGLTPVVCACIRRKRREEEEASWRLRGGPAGRGGWRGGRPPGDGKAARRGPADPARAAPKTPMAEQPPVGTVPRSRLPRTAPHCSVQCRSLQVIAERTARPNPAPASPPAKRCTMEWPGPAPGWR